MDVKEIDKEIEDLKKKLAEVRGTKTVVYRPIKNGSIPLCNWGKWRTESAEDNA